MRAAHPGTIVFFREGRPPRLQRATEVPHAVAFVGDEPVVRVVSAHVGSRRVVRSYGVGQQLLQSTWQALKPT